MRVMRGIPLLILLTVVRGKDASVDSNGDVVVLPVKDGAVAPEDCECSDLTRTIELKLESVNAMHQAAKAKVEESTSTIQRLQASLVHAEQHAKEVEELKLKLAEKEAALKMTDGQLEQVIKENEEKLDRVLKEKAAQMSSGEETLHRALKEKDAQIELLQTTIQENDQAMKLASQESSKEVTECQRKKANVERELNEALQSKKESESSIERYKVAREMEIDELKKELKETKQSDSKHSDLYSTYRKKHETSNRNLMAAEHELKRIQSESQRYCNTTAIAQDATELAMSTHKAVVQTLTPYFQQGTAQSEATVGRVLQRAHEGAKGSKRQLDVAYETHLRHHVDHRVKPMFDKHVQPHLQIAKTKALDVMESTRLFCVSCIREGCKNWMWWVKLREGTLSKEDRPSASSRSRSDRLKRTMLDRDSGRRAKGNTSGRPKYPDWFKNALQYGIDHAEELFSTGSKAFLALYLLRHWHWTLHRILTIAFLPILIPVWLMSAMVRKLKGKSSKVAMNGKGGKKGKKAKPGRRP